MARQGICGSRRPYPRPGLDAGERLVDPPGVLHWRNTAGTSGVTVRGPDEAVVTTYAGSVCADLLVRL